MSCTREQVYQSHIQRRPEAAVVVSLAIALTALTASCDRGEPRQPDLPQRQDVWRASLALDSDSKLQYVGKTTNYLITTATTVKNLNSPRTISVGDEIEGVRIGAIRCSFFSKDESYGGEQFMWRGCWGCQAGRSKEEIENAVGADGEKRFDYLYISPLSLKE
jgi:hypothetical protein